MFCFSISSNINLRQQAQFFRILNKARDYPGHILILYRLILYLIAVRLRSPTYVSSSQVPSAGAVIVSDNNEWTLVCDTDWDANDASMYAYHAID